MNFSNGENGEIYVDDVLDFGYESEAMFIEPEEYIRFPLPKGEQSIVFDQSRLNYLSINMFSALVDTTNTSKSDTSILVPRSLFDRSNLLLNTQATSLSTNSLNKSRSSNNTPKSASNVATPQTPPNIVKARQLPGNNSNTPNLISNSPNTNVIMSTPSTPRPVKLEEILSKDNFQGVLDIDNNDWLISEDYKVLDCIQNVQQLPVASSSLTNPSMASKIQTMLPNSTGPLLPPTAALASSPIPSMVNNTTNALTQNWDFISDLVNRYSRVLRTPKQCKHRFEQVIGPREEGRVVYDPIKKKKHVIKGAVKVRKENYLLVSYAYVRILSLNLAF